MIFIRDGFFHRYRKNTTFMTKKNFAKLQRKNKQRTY